MNGLSSEFSPIFGDCSKLVLELQLMLELFEGKQQER